MTQKIKIIVEFEAYEPDSELYEGMSIRDIAEQEVEAFESDPAALLDMQFERVRYKLVDD